MASSDTDHLNKPACRSRCLTLVALAVALTGPSVWATPPAYSTFGREQRVDHAPDASDLLRIWVAYVAQGDGILIQLPERFNYDNGERREVLIDGGSYFEADDSLMLDFLRGLYGSDDPHVEYAVITHHDRDHVGGFTHLLRNSSISFNTVFHNGLASYRAGHRGFPTDSRPDDAVVDFADNRLKRGMGFLDQQGNFRPEWLIGSLADLRTRSDASDLQGVYEDLAAALLAHNDDNQLVGFARSCVGAPFIGELEAQANRPLGDKLRFDVLWPLDKLRPYKSRDWGYTINGNSVTFKLTYGNFSMLFTGDQNDKSEDALLAHAPSANALACDVLKVPHHGSRHGTKAFFERANPVVSVASMGSQGFGKSWKHPSDEVIGWLGGFHRVYHTHIHERVFTWSELVNDDDLRADLVEKSHLLIETDGEWFRIVEIAVDSADLAHPPDVAAVRRSNGTRWIRTN